MKKLVYALLIVFAFVNRVNAQWVQMGNTLQRTSDGYSYRTNLGSPGFAYWYTKAQIDSLVNSFNTKFILNGTALQGSSNFHISGTGTFGVGTNAYKVQAFGNNGQYIGLDVSNSNPNLLIASDNIGVDPKITFTSTIGGSGNSIIQGNQSRPSLFYRSPEHHFTDFNNTMDRLSILPSGNVGIGNSAPTYPFSVTPFQYNTGTVSQSGNIITGVGTTFTSAMVGSHIVFGSNGDGGLITGFTDATHLTAANSATYGSQTYTISYNALNINSTGHVLLGVTPTITTGITYNLVYDPITMEIKQQLAGSGGSFIQNQYGLNTIQPNSKISVSDSIKTPSVITGGSFNATSTNSSGSVYACSILPTNTATNYRGLDMALSGEFTSGTYNLGQYGAHVVSQVGPTNTQNWTATSGLTGILGSVRTITGATGTITNATNLNLTEVLNSTGALFTNHRFIYIQTPSGSGNANVTNEAGIFMQTISNGSNSNVYILTGASSYPTGNWGLYHNSSYNNYLGTGATLINTTTDNGADKLQVNGSILSTAYNTTNWKLYESSGTFHLNNPGAGLDAFSVNSGGDITMPNALKVAGSISTPTLTINGASTGSVGLSYPSTSTNTNASFPVGSSSENIAYQSWVNANFTPTGSGVTSVSNSDGTMNISPTTGGVISSVNQSHNFTWGGTHIYNGSLTSNVGIALQGGFGASFYNSGNTFSTLLYNSGSSANYNIALPSASGTLALVSGNLGTPTTLIGTNITGTASGLNIGGNAATVTTIPNLTGPVTSVGNATAITASGVSAGSYTNANITVGADGRVTSASNGGTSINFSDNEIPSGAINSTNTNYTLAHTPTTGSVKVYRNGLRQIIITDYTVSGSTITYTYAPTTGDTLIVDYRY